MSNEEPRQEIFTPDKSVWKGKYTLSEEYAWKHSPESIKKHSRGNSREMPYIIIDNHDNGDIKLYIQEWRLTEQRMSVCKGAKKVLASAIGGRFYTKHVDVIRELNNRFNPIVQPSQFRERTIILVDIAESIITDTYENANNGRDEENEETVKYYKNLFEGYRKKWFEKYGNKDDTYSNSPHLFWVVRNGGNLPDEENIPDVYDIEEEPYEEDGMFTFEDITSAYRDKYKDVMTERKSIIEKQEANDKRINHLFGEIVSHLISLHKEKTEVIYTEEEVQKLLEHREIETKERIINQIKNKKN